MTLQGAVPTEVHATGTGGPTVRTRPTPRTFWTIVAVLIAVVVGWQVVGRLPALVPTGASFVDPTFVQYQSDFPTHDAPWVVWDAPEGASTALVLAGSKPWPITVVAPESTAGVSVRVASMAAGDYGMREPDSYALTESVVVPPHGHVLVDVTVSAACLTMSAGNATGVGSVDLTTEAFGVVSSTTVELLTTFMAGYTTDHEPDPSCPDR